MPRFLVTHAVKRIYDTQEALIRDWQGLRRRSRGVAEWLRTLYAPAAGRLYCEWEADDRQAIEGCFLPAELGMAPIERIDEMALIDPAWLD